MARYAILGWAQVIHSTGLIRRSDWLDLLAGLIGLR